MAYLNGKKVLSVVQTTPVAGTVDTEMSDSSTNAVQNKVIKGYVDGKVTDIENGTIVAGKALTSKQLENVSDSSGSTQTDPFIFQATGTNNNTTETPTAPVAKQLELRGNTVVYNQLAYQGASTSQYYIVNESLTSFSFSNGLFTVKSQDNTRYWDITFTKNLNSQHKYLFILNVKTFSGNFFVRKDGANSYTVTSSGFKAYLLESTTTLALHTVNVNTSDTTFEMYLFDLTQWFNGNIPTDILNNLSKFSNYHNGALPYDTGTLKTANANKLVTIFFNQWDNAVESGYWSDTTGEKKTGANWKRNENPIRVVANTTYYSYWENTTTDMILIFRDKNGTPISTLLKSNWVNHTFTTPNNCYDIVFYFTYTWSGGKVNFNLSWDGERDGENEPYVMHSYALGNDTLRSAGSAYDVKTADGTITRNIGQKTIDGEIGDVIAFTTIKPNTTNVICSLGALSEWGTISGTNITLTKAVTDEVVYFEVAEPTAEQGTAFAENIEVDDYGTMAFMHDNDYVEVPQGNKLFYPADYVLSIDDLVNYTNGDVTKLALKTDIPTVPTIADYSSEVTYTDLTAVSVAALEVASFITLGLVFSNSANTITTGTTLFTLGNSLNYIDVLPAILYDGNGQGNNILLTVDASGNVTASEDIYVQSTLVVNFTY